MISSLSTASFTGKTIFGKSQKSIHIFKLENTNDLLFTYPSFKRFYNTKAKIYSLEVSDKQYEIIKNEIKFIELEKNKYKFNIAGLFAVGFSKKIGGENSFYCAEFVKYLFEKAKIGMILPEIVRPENFNNRDELIEVYHGFLRKYNAEKVKFSDILKESILLYNKKESIV